MKDVQDYKKFDIIQQYRDYAQELEHDLEVQKRMLEFEENRSRRGTTVRKLLKSAARGESLSV
jgi:hypothetical protein